MSNGIGCICAAYGECECACGADWTDQEVYDLREEVAGLRKALYELLKYCYQFNSGEAFLITDEVIKNAAAALNKKDYETTN